MVHEDQVLADFLSRVRASGLVGDVRTIGIGDDAAVVPIAGSLVTSVDVVVAGIHADLSLTSLHDFGWRAVSAALSDLAAMGVEPLGLLSSVVSPDLGRFLELGEGIIDAATEADCPILGGDLSRGPVWSVSITVFGETRGESVVLRSGAKAGDTLLVTGPLGGAAQGLTLLQHSGATARFSEHEQRLVERHCRPLPRLRAGRAARLAHVHAMCDLSDGLGLDLHRLATASGVGVELDEIPIDHGASEAQALGGGDDYELLMATSDVTRLNEEFARLELPLPLVIGKCVADPTMRKLRGNPFPASGWKH
jgi:thiamine-monophosphate kinase